MFSLSKKNLLKDGVYSTNIEGLFYIDHQQHSDRRGFYTELSRIETLNNIITKPFITAQLNHSRSNKNVMRGIHAEKWRKLISITQGVCFSALVDLRKDSPTFKNVETFLLGFSDTALDGSLFVPKGLGNSLLAVEGPLDYIYCVDELYSQRDPKFDQAIDMFDPALEIKWPINKNEAVLSKRDIHAVNLETFLSL